MRPVRDAWKACCEESFATGLAAGEEETKFAFRGTGVKVLEELRGGPMQSFFEKFGEFAGDTDFTRGIDDIQGLQSFQDAVGGFVEERGMREVKSFGEDAGALPGFVGEKSPKIKGRGVEARAHQSRDGGAGTGQNLNGKSGKAGFTDQP